MCKQRSNRWAAGLYTRAALVGLLVVLVLCSGHIGEGTRYVKVIIETRITQTFRQADDLQLPTPDELVQCPDYNVSTMPDLKTERRWRSRREVQPDEITLVTQLSMERLSMLERQCSKWAGRIAAVLYIPVIDGEVISQADPSLNNTELAASIQEVNRVYTELGKQGACALDLEVLTEEVPSAYLSGLYPFNALRNRALLLAKTEALLILDVDFMVSAQEPPAFAAMLPLLRQGGIVVLPAFEHNPEKFKAQEEAKAFVVSSLSADKEEAVRLVMNESLIGFHMKKYRVGHDSTNYGAWVKSSEPYNITFREGYEPYVLVAREHVPWADERFRGYAWDKVVYMFSLAGKDGLFWVGHPTAFVVHFPHPVTVQEDVTVASGQWDLSTRLYVDAKQTIPSRTYIPHSPFNCAAPQRRRHRLARL